jgi:hypothetical protein
MSVSLSAEIRHKSCGLTIAGAVYQAWIPSRKQGLANPGIPQHEVTWFVAVKAISREADSCGVGHPIGLRKWSERPSPIHSCRDPNANRDIVFSMFTGLFINMKVFPKVKEYRIIEIPTKYSWFNIATIQALSYLNEQARLRISETSILTPTSTTSFRSITTLYTNFQDALVPCRRAQLLPYVYLTLHMNSY